MPRSTPQYLHLYVHGGPVFSKTLLFFAHGYILCNHVHQNAGKEFHHCTQQCHSAVVLRQSLIALLEYWQCDTSFPILWHSSRVNDPLESAPQAKRGVSPLHT